MVCWFNIAYTIRVLSALPSGYHFAYLPKQLQSHFQKAAMTLKMELPPAAGRLCIYRWAQQAIDMDVSHPILPLMWQRFFLLYLSRTASEPG